MPEIKEMPMKIRKTLLLMSLALPGLLSPAAHTHHAFSSEFDADKPFLLRGTVVRVEWINPHSWIHVDVVDEVIQVSNEAAFEMAQKLAQQEAYVDQ